MFMVIESGTKCAWVIHESKAVKRTEMSRTYNELQSTLVISKSKGLYEILRDIRRFAELRKR